MAERTNATATTQNVTSGVRNGAVVVSGHGNSGEIPVDASSRKRDTQERDLDVNIALVTEEDQLKKKWKTRHERTCHQLLPLEQTCPDSP